MKPDEFERIWRIIDVLDPFKAVKAVFFIIQRNINNIIDLLLPVLGKSCEPRAMKKEKAKKEFSHSWDFIKNNKQLSLYRQVPATNTVLTAGSLFF
jgi:hypothetical protein